MLNIINVSKYYHLNDSVIKALNNVNIEIQEGKIHGVVGLSGAGKSTLLRAIADLENLDSGNIIVDGIDITSLKGTEKRTFKSNIGVVFQGYNLLMQSTVKENIAFPLKIAGIRKDKIEERIVELLKIVNLTGKEFAYPAQLSGGQKQRVGIARALALSPKILLLDEVTSALDPLTTRQILKLLKKINMEFKVTMLIITHHLEILSLICDEASLLKNGEVILSGTVKEVYDSVISQFERSDEDV